MYYFDTLILRNIRKTKIMSYFESYLIENIRP